MTKALQNRFAPQIKYECIHKGKMKHKELNDTYMGARHIQEGAGRIVTQPSLFKVLPRLCVGFPVCSEQWWRKHCPVSTKRETHFTGQPG